jgi:hypothetical protein
VNEQNLVRRLSYLAPGDGYRRCVPIDILAAVKSGATTGSSFIGGVLTATTVPAIAPLEANFYGLSVVASANTCGVLKWAVPDDYDDSADELRLRILCNMAGDTNVTTTLDAAIYRKRPNPGLIGTEVDLSANLGVTASTIYVPRLTSLATDFLASTANSNTAWYEINADYNLPAPTAAQIAAGTKNRSLYSTADASIKAGDALSITLSSSAHTTDAISIYAMEIWYRSNLAFTDINKR